VAQYAIGILIDHGKRHDHPVFKSFGYAAGTDADLTRYGVGLLKFRVIIVKDDWIPETNGIPEDPAMQIIPLFGPVRNPTDGIRLFGIIMNRKMRCLKDLKIKGSVPGLVLPKKLRLRLSMTKHHQRYKRYNPDQPFHIDAIG
jgi:hypothetical protein